MSTVPTPTTALTLDEINPARTVVSDDWSAVANAVPSLLNAAIAASVAEVSTAD